MCQLSACPLFPFLKPCHTFFQHGVPSYHFHAAFSHRFRLLLSARELHDGELAIIARLQEDGVTA